MGLEHVATVWKHSRQSGSRLVILLAIASYSDQKGEWITDQATLQRRVRLSNRHFRHLLAELVAAGELAVVSHHGRGKLSTYRLLVGQENWQPSATFPGEEEADSQFSTEDLASGSQFSDAELASDSQFSAADSQFSAPLGPPFPPDPLIPLYPPKKADMESFALAPRPLSGPQSATFRTNLLLEEAGIPLPSPAQISLWLQKLGSIERLLDLLRELIQAGLATKKNPAAYIHRVVMERTESPEPASPLDARTGRKMLRVQRRASRPR